MLLSYKIELAQLVQCDAAEASILIYNQPTDVEKNDLLRLDALDQANLDAIFDSDEVPRIEYSDQDTLIIWKHPKNVSSTVGIQFEVSSLGIVIGQNKIVLIVPYSELPTTGREFKKIVSPEDFVLRTLLYTIHHYQDHLKVIKLMSEELEVKVVKSMENRYLLQMFTLGESLIYYHNALEANLSILSKMKGVVSRLKLEPDQIVLLDDITIETQQASKQASIYSMILSGLMDARGTIVNNNMSILLKNLTLINVVFLPLNLIASIGGMSEFSMMTQKFDWRIAYLIFSLMMVILGWSIWWWLVIIVERGKLGNKN